MGLEIKPCTVVAEESACHLVNTQKLVTLLVTESQRNV